MSQCHVTAELSVISVMRFGNIIKVWTIGDAKIEVFKVLNDHENIDPNI